jgi:molybdate transport system substrate-binding protein
MKACCIFLSLLLFSCADSGREGQEAPVKLNIAVAANMQYAMDSIVTLFEAEEHIECEVTANASGMLTAQIEKGAPYDVFVSANMEFPRELQKKGFSKAPTVYSYGRLGLVFSKDKGFKTVEEVFADPDVKRIALADPETAPYGIAAIEFLKNVGLFEANKSRIVYGESISQVNQYLSTASVEAGFTSMSFLTKFEKDYGYIEIDEGKYGKIEQGVSLLKHGWTENEEAAQKFITFLGSQKCRKVLTWFGYRVP